MSDAISPVSKQWLYHNLNEEAKLSHFQADFLSFAYIAEFRVPGTMDHLRRVSAYTCYVAESILGWTSHESKRLGIAALMHDMGKIAIDPNLLLKPGLLTADERKDMQLHSKLGHDIIEHLEQNFFAPIASFDKKLFTFTKQIALYHHENFDGSGYPEGRVGDNIPIAARVVKLTDVIDALLTKRSYKAPWSWQKARAEVVSLEDSEFDGYLLRRLLEREHEFLELVASQDLRLES